VHPVTRARLGPVELTLGKLDELVENLRLVRIRTAPSTAVVVPSVRESKLASQRVEPMHVAPVIALAARLRDFTIDPRVRTTLGVSLCVRVAFVRGLSPAIADANDLIAVTPLVVDLSPCVGEALVAMVPRAMPVVARRQRLCWRPNGPYCAVLDFRCNHHGRAPLSAAIVIIVVGASLAHYCERQYKESEVK
jgi:hypothetical protein